jgi:hypothetical protein
MKVDIDDKNGLQINWLLNWLVFQVKANKNEMTFACYFR